MDGAGEVGGGDLGPGSSAAHTSFVALDKLEREPLLKGLECEFRSHTDSSSNPYFHFFFGRVNLGKHLKSLPPLSHLQAGGNPSSSSGPFGKDYVRLGLRRCI